MPQALFCPTVVCAMKLLLRVMLGLCSWDRITKGRFPDHPGISRNGTTELSHWL